MAGFRIPTSTPTQPVAPVALLDGMPGTAPSTRLAGEALEENPGLIKWLAKSLGIGDDVGTQAKNAVKGATQGAQNLPGKANQAFLRLVQNNAGKIASGTAIGTILGAAGEFGDDDPIGRNVAEAGGNVAGNLGGLGAGILLGTPFGPIGQAVLGTAGAIYGADKLSDAAGGIYDAVVGESQGDRERKKRIKDAAVLREIEADNFKQQLLAMSDLAKLKRADDFARADRNLELQNEYNYANALNQAMINAQAQENILDQAAMQYVLG